MYRGTIEFDEPLPISRARLYGDVKGRDKEHIRQLKRLWLATRGEHLRVYNREYMRAYRKRKEGW